tara:strand:- start:75 stop:557 length:483 start_codon:yes stop_codon:yes gene_type:complete
MIHFVFDLDDTLIIHNKHVPMEVYVQEDKELSNLLNLCKGECYIYTNGTLGHAMNVINKMNIKDVFHKVYSRDNIPYMKPNIKSFQSIQDDLNYIHNHDGVIFFFDDLLENLETAKSLGWVTFWINPKYKNSPKHSFVDYSFRDIKTCLKYIEKLNNSIF